MIYVPNYIVVFYGNNHLVNNILLYIFMDVNILNMVTPLKIFVFTHLDNSDLDSLSSRCKMFAE